MVIAQLEESARLRQVAKDEKEQARNLEKAPEENYIKIDEHFNTEFGELEVALMAWASQVEGKSADEVTAYFDGLFERFSKLRDYIADINYALPSSLSGKYSNGFNAWNENFGKEKDKAIPKKKFSFARKEKKTKKKEEKKVESEAGEAKSTIVKNSQGNHLWIKNVYNKESIVVSASEYEGKENVIIESVEHCVIYLPFLIKCLFIKEVKNCQVFVGAVSGASFVNDVNDSEIFLQSHQIRIHNSKNVKFYLTARSSPIIEHCSELGFGPYHTSQAEATFTYEGREKHEEEAGLKLEEGKNLFD